MLSVPPPPTRMTQANEPQPSADAPELSGMGGPEPTATPAEGQPAAPSSLGGSLPSGPAETAVAAPAVGAALTPAPLQDPVPPSESPAPLEPPASLDAATERLRDALTPDASPTEPLELDTARAALLQPPLPVPVPETKPGAELLPPGARIDRFLVIDLIGQGARGPVYAVFDPLLDRKLALKLLEPTTAVARDDLRDRLRAEAEVLAGLTHPNLVRLVETGEHQHRVYLVTEMAHGHTLDVWRRETQRSWREVRDVFLQVARALAAAHAAGLAHGYLTAHDIFVDRLGRVQLTGFGLPVPTTPPGEARRDGARFLEPLLAPEQLRGEPPDGASDQFTFSACFFEALYGEPPFQQRLPDGPPVKPLAPELDRQAPGYVPPRLRDAVLKGLSDQPAQRFPSMGAMQRELERSPVRHLWALAALTVLAVASGAVFANVQARLSRAEACRSEAKRLAWDAWNPERSKALHAAFLATRAPYADKLLERVERALDQRFADWAKAHVSTCEAGLSLSRDDFPLVAVRARCLARVHAGLSETAAILAKADLRTVERAPSALHALPAAEPCFSLDAAPRLAALARSEGHWARMEPLELGLSRGQAAALLQPGDPARQALTRTVAELRGFSEPGLAAEALVSLGALEAELGAPLAARKHFEEAALEAESARLPAWVGEATLAWARLEAEQPGRFDVAQGFLARARATRGARDEAGTTLQVETVTGDVLLAHGRYLDAEAAYQRALAAARDGAPEDAVLARALCGRAAVLQPLGRSAEALEPLEQCVERVQASFGDGHPETALAQAQLGELLVSLGQAERALALHRAARETWERSLGPAHLRVAEAMAAEGTAQAALGRHEAALEARERALKIREAALPATHEQVTSLMLDVASSLSALGRSEPALALRKRVLARVEKRTGPAVRDLADALEAVGRGSLEAGAVADAEAAYVKAAALAPRAYGATQPELAAVLAGLGQVRLLRKAAAAAVEPLERALKIYQARPAAHRETGLVRFALARAVTESRGEPARAQALAQAAQEDLTLDGERSKKELRELESWMTQRRAGPPPRSRGRGR